MEFKVKSAIVAERWVGRQHLFRIVCGCPRGLFGAGNFGKPFFRFRGNQRTRILRTHFWIGSVLSLAGIGEIQALGFRNSNNAVTIFLRTAPVATWGAVTVAATTTISPLDWVWRKFVPWLVGIVWWRQRPNLFLIYLHGVRLNLSVW